MRWSIFMQTGIVVFISYLSFLKFVDILWLCQCPYACVAPFTKYVDIDIFICAGHAFWSSEHLNDVLIHWNIKKKTLLRPSKKIILLTQQCHTLNVSLFFNFGFSRRNTSQIKTNIPRSQSWSLWKSLINYAHEFSLK